MKKIISSILCLSVAFFVSCDKNDSGDSNAVAYKIINNGNAGVTSITDGADVAGLSIAQAIPGVSGETYPANMPILFFFDDKILISSITTDSFIVTEDGEKVGGTISINEASNGFAIVCFIPKNQFKANAAIQITLTTELQDDAGLGNATDKVIDFNTSPASPSSFDTNGDFENGTDGVSFVGDGNILTGAQGCVSPFGGSNFGGITTGAQLISGGSAVGGASSIMILGPISTNVSTVSFNYNFGSTEFQEFVGSVFDDSFVAMVVGDDGAYTEFITSVNTVGLAGNTACTGFTGFPDTGDDYFGATGWTSRTLNFDDVGGTAYIMFISTDVADQIYSTFVGIDNVTFN